MSKFNIGHLSGVTVNTTEKLVNKVKKDVPAATNATKSGIKGWKNSVKAAYKDAREGVVEAEVIDNSVRNDESIAVRAIRDQDIDYIQSVLEDREEFVGWNEHHGTP